MRKGAHIPLLHRLFGRPDFGNLEGRLVNILSFSGGLVGVATAVENAVIAAPVPLIAACALQGVLLLGLFVLSRFYGYYRAVSWPVMTVISGFLCVLFVYNGGSQGGAQYFFLVAALCGAILVPGWQKALMAALYAIPVTALLAAEYRNPGIITDYRSPEDRYFDVGFSYVLCISLFALLAAVISGHYYELMRRNSREQSAFREDLHLARELQRRIVHLPSEMYGFDAAVLYRPAASLGGDFFEVHAEPGRLRILTADITGHGINAALSSMLAKGEWARARHERSPADALMRWNETLYGEYRDAMTLSACVLDLGSDGRVDFASAGHALQHLVRAGQTTVLPATGILIGLEPHSRILDTSYPACEFTRVVLFTDGLYEQPDQLGRAIGIQWLSDIVSAHTGSAAAVLADIESAFLRRSGRTLEESADDLTLIVAQRRSAR